MSEQSNEHGARREVVAHIYDDGTSNDECNGDCPACLEREQQYVEGIREEVTLADPDDETQIYAAASRAMYLAEQEVIKALKQVGPPKRSPSGPPAPPSSAT
ncbi:hypothetical protein [Streptomyces nanshensis]|uniref:Uncharacterized protein n=1 Tax=Streptomyces nanshensis TaxID=518642 RepID=A0A1E7LAV9_9ACTN|nr:hypothetical protein [Streptomyces nanshensis]OEV13290.1 hypothetical protein AN218_04210 [Streptomyces nanshensis]